VGLTTIFAKIFASNPNTPKEERRNLPRLSVEMYQRRGTVVGGHRQQKLTQHLLSWPQGRSAKKRIECLILQKDHIERLYESKLEIKKFQLNL
jgi:hypothetical protein